MRQVRLHEAEQNLAAEAEAGESLTILRNGRPVA
jgi:antitoxin (DNA-binding transcriptional repressor) of toxin-antitoxin stability system